MAYSRKDSMFNLEFFIQDLRGAQEKIKKEGRVPVRVLLFVLNAYAKFDPDNLCPLLLGGG